METIEAKYNEQARDAGVYIVSACGFDSIPNDIGALMVQRSFNGDLSYVDSYITPTGQYNDVSCTVLIDYTCKRAVLTIPL